MDYKERLEASQNKAHLRIIATKIDRDMRQLRSIADSSPTARRRWIWELLQNGKDVHNGNGIRFRIEMSPKQNELAFKHTGKPFTADDIRFLIEQISTKDRSRNELGLRKSTGQFGTGFLATHLLSERVTVFGVAKEPELDFKRFSFVLDRSGYELNAIEAAVTSAKRLISGIDKLASLTDYDAAEYNTAFVYPLDDDLAKRAAIDGLKDLEHCLPYTLTYAPEILDVHIPNLGNHYNLIATDSVPDSPFVVNTIQVSNADSGDSHEYRILSYTKDFTTISIPISYVSGQIQIEAIPDSTPKLFCDFPLVGTELFPFPAIINSSNFEPTDARDGVFLTETESRPNPNARVNRAIIERAVSLFLELAEFGVEKGWRQLYNLVNLHSMSNPTEWVDSLWHRENVVKPVRSKLLYLPIVSTDSSSSLAPLKDPNGSLKILFPSGPTKEIRDKLWLLTSKITVARLPFRQEVETWNSRVWDECEKLTVERLAEWVQGRSSKLELRKLLHVEDVSEWLADLYALIQMDEEKYDTMANKFAIFPNQNGKLCRAAELYRQEGHIPDAFKDILSLLGSDIRTDLAANETPSQIAKERLRNESFVVERISALVLEKSADRTQAERYRDPFSRLLKWFRDNESKSKALFPLIYSRKHILYDDAVIMDNLDRADQLVKLMNETGTASVEELKALLAKGQQNFLPITQEVLASMGITDVGKWEAALKDKDLAEVFSHASIPTTEMFILAQSLIENAKTRVESHLRTLQQYDLTNIEQLAPTVLGGILKDGVEIQIVVRPALNGEVIIYYSAEQDVLDFEENSELWADTGSIPQRVTLGHILKKSEIRKFRI